MTTHSHHDTPYGHVAEFMTKIGQVLVRERLGTSKDGVKDAAIGDSLGVDFSVLVQHDGFWKSGLPVHIDIVGMDHILYERWVMSFEFE